MSKSFTVNIGSNKIETTVVTDESKLERFLIMLFSNIKPHHRTFHRVVGLGIEKSFSYDGVMMREKVAVLKLCAEKYCLIVHLTHFIEIPTCLAKFLDFSDITVVGVGIKQNLCDLTRDYGIQCRNAVLELRDFAAACFEKDHVVCSHTLQSLYKYLEYNSYLIEFDVLGDYSVESAVNVAFSDWGSSELSLEQICHASMEVHASALIAADLAERI
jgi:hypothetical protein